MNISVEGIENRASPTIFNEKKLIFFYPNNIIIFTTKQSSNDDHRQTVCCNLEHGEGDGQHINNNKTFLQAANDTQKFASQEGLIEKKGDICFSILLGL